jgi:cell wall-associated NlpC family hydrolase
MKSPLPHLPTPVQFPVPPDLERAQRARVVAAALSWCGTPYRQMGYVKGPKGAVDCSMLLVGAWVEARVFQPFDPRPYPSDWMLHRSEERYLGWLSSIGAETKIPQHGDVIAYVYGRCYSHAAIIVDDNFVVHAFADNRQCIKTERNWATLQRVRGGGDRPQLYFDMWARLREVA